MIGADRAALYAPDASADDLAACARYAHSIGLRIVTIIDEELAGETPLGGKGLNQLTERLAAGEFELIVAHTGNGRLVTLQAAVGEIADHPVPLRCAIYTRCANVSPATPLPMADQRDACEIYAARQGWNAIATYTDRGMGGRRVSRDGLDAMMAQARQGGFDLLVIKDLDRLSRDPLHLQFLLTELNSAGVLVHTMTGPIACDPSWVRHAS